MAQRRMFSLQIVDTDAFLDMPQNTQLLYFHLAMRADDDGFVSNVKRIMRMIGSNDDDLKVLFTKNFLIPFESGVCVIKHWRIHNYIQKDRHQATKYLDEMSKLILKDNGSYSLDTKCIQDGYILDTQDRLGKVSIGKDSVEEQPVSFSLYGEFKNVKLTATEYMKLTNQYGENPTQSLIEELSNYIASSGKRYKSHYATLLNWARRKIQEHVREVSNNKNTVAF